MIISVSNQKGGVGKTTTTQSLAAVLKSKGHKVLLIDLDPQSNLSTALNANNSQVMTIYEVMKNECSIKDAIQETESGDIVPSSMLLSVADMEFTKLGREQMLKEALEPVKDQYDYIVIDTPPALSVLTLNAFTASDKLIIPMEADMFSLQGLGQLNSTVQQVIKYSNKNLVIAGVLLTKHNPRTNLSKNVTAAISSGVAQLNTKLFNTYIRNGISIREAQISQENIMNYSPTANAQSDYLKFVDEFLAG